MIGLLNGKVAYYNSVYLLLDVGGVGYKVIISQGVQKNLKNIGQSLSLHIYTHVREDLLELYGFLHRDDLELFEMLLSVSGVGPKTAMSIFSKGQSKDIVTAISSADIDFFTSVPRLGRKNAQKIIIELKNKVGGTKDLDLKELDDKESQEILSALKTFGFTTGEIRESLKSITDKNISTDKKIKLALQFLGK